MFRAFPPMNVLKGILFKLASALMFAVMSSLYFLLTWFPTYLVQQRGLTALKAGAAICGVFGPGFEPSTTPACAGPRPTSARRSRMVLRS